MVQKEFSGDPQFRLPKGKVEPYRLWFEFLKVALRYPNVQVDSVLYRDWHVRPETDFDGWWSEHWRQLFATKAETAVVESVDDFQVAVGDPRFAVVRVSLFGTKKQRMKDIEEALSTKRVPSGVSRTSPTKAAFVISAKRSMNLRTLRGMLKFLQLYEIKNWDLEEASLAYLKWASGWNEKVRLKKWKRPLVYIPPFLGTFVAQLEKRRAVRKAGPKGEKYSGSYDRLRGQARRFVRRGEKILRNVAAGRFPGSF